MRNSGDLRRSRNEGGARLAGWTLVLAAALLIAVAWAAFVTTGVMGWRLYYGDAEAHLNIARRLVDAREPGYEQIGTVWLPLPHLMMMPLAKDDALWRSGAAGALPAAVCFALGGVFVFLAMRRLFASEAAAWTALAAWTLNPNMLYLASTPMTEAISLCWFAGLAWSLARLRDTSSIKDAAAAGAFVLAGTLTRYEFWALIPAGAAAVVLLAKQRRWSAAAVFACVASMGALWWLAHNRVLYSNPLEFYNGYWSAKAIYQRARDGGMAAYPGDHDWRQAFAYFMAAARHTLGWPLLLLGALGMAAAVWKRAWVWAALSALPAGFYVLSLYSSGTPIFVPDLWPNTYYNTRYGLAALPLVCTGVAALAAVFPREWRVGVAGLLVALAVAPWITDRVPESWVCWKESKVNSEWRREWTREAALYMALNYKRGQGIFTSFGDLTGILREAGIPLKEASHEVERVPWLAAAAQPQKFLHEEWAISFSGDRVSQAMTRTMRGPRRWERMRMYSNKGNPVVEIWRRAQ